MNGRDKEQARRLFNRYPRGEQDQIGKWVIQQLATVWRTPAYTPRPYSALRSEGWKRTAAQRTVPSSIDIAVERVYARRKAEGKL